MSDKINFTKTSLIELIEKNAGRRLVVRDMMCRGLIAELRPGGSLTFYFYRFFHGRPARIKIGPFPALSVENARKAVAKMQGAVAEGKDPRVERQRAKTMPDLKALFTHWMESHAKLHKRTWKADEDNYRKFLAKWGTRRLSDIKRGDVVALHTKIGKENGPYAANRVLALLRAMFNKAIELGFEGHNPCDGVGLFAEQARDRFLQPDELPKFFEAVEAETPLFRDFFLLALFVGARRGNVMAMRWEEINLDSAIWRMPRTKNSDPLTVPLSGPALEILRRRKKEAGDSPWVFPSYGKTGHLVTPKGAWTRVLERAGLSDLRIHDLRRTLGSWQASTGASLPVIGKSLGHRSQAATAIYARLNLDPVRASVDKATAAIVEAAKKSAKHEQENNTKDSETPSD
jgi:integrase